MNKTNLQKTQERIDKVQNNRIKIIGEYTNSRTPVMVKCLVCGLEWKTSPQTLTDKYVGRNCNHHIKLTSEMASKKIIDATNGCINMVGDYKGARTRTLMKCNKCDYEWKTEPYAIYKMLSGCPRCSGKAKITLDDIKEAGQEEYSIIGKLNSSHSKSLFLHKKCGNKFEMTTHSFMSGTRCPKCSLKEAHLKQQLPISIAKRRLLASRKGEFEIVKGYRGISHRCWIKHSKGCGKEFYTWPGDIISHRSGCPYCYVSYGEEAVRNYLEENNFCFKEQFKIPECKNIRPLPFDFAVFQNSKLLFLIEYQGIQHYSNKFGDEAFSKTVLRDKIKYDYCKSHGINLIRIPYKRWYHRFKSLQKQVNNYLDKNISKSIPNQAS